MSASNTLNCDWLRFWSNLDSDCNMEHHNQVEELDDRAYTESFDDVMTICPRPGMTAQERYEFRKKNKPSLTKRFEVYFEYVSIPLG
jgi:hypothetical protein